MDKRIMEALHDVRYVNQMLLQRGSLAYRVMNVNCSFTHLVQMLRKSIWTVFLAQVEVGNV